MTPRLTSLPCRWLLLACAGCTSSHQFGLRLQPGQQGRLQVFGDNPLVQIDNDGPGSVEVSFTPGVGMPDRVRVLRGGLARTLRGGGRLQFVLLEGSHANMQVRVQGSTGIDLRLPANGP